MTATYTVTFDSNGGSEVIAQSIEEGSLVTEPTSPTKDGYVFANWYTESALTNVFDFTTVIVEADTILYAGWEKVTYTVTFDGTAADGDYTIEAQVVEDGTSASTPTPAPTKDGYTFDGWFTASTGGTEFVFGTTLVSEDITLYAQFTIVG